MRTYKLFNTDKGHQVMTFVRIKDGKTSVRMETIIFNEDHSEGFVIAKEEELPMGIIEAIMVGTTQEDAQDFMDQALEEVHNMDELNEIAQKIINK